MARISVGFTRTIQYRDRMGRSFSPSDLIKLPRVSANEGAVLALELLNEAKAHKKLPARIDAARKRLEIAHHKLQAALTPAAGETADTQAQILADRAIDNAWSATSDWLRGWTKLPGDEQAQASALFAVLFPDGLAFTQKPYKIEWQESESRLRAIDEQKLGKTFDALGGDGFLHHLRAEHKNYGEALGVTSPKKQVEKIAVVRPALDALLDALRVYATKVAAHADPDEAGSEELSAALLGPLSTWHSRAPAAEATPPGPNPPPPQPPAAS